MTEVISTDAIRLAYEAGRRDAFAEAAKALQVSPSTIRLHAGEITAQEMRTVRAVLKWKEYQIANEMGNPSWRVPTKPVEHREVKPTDFIGKTIVAFDGSSCNNWKFWFADGTAFALHIECDMNGLPDPLICEGCIDD